MSWALRPRAAVGRGAKVTPVSLTFNLSRRSGGVDWEYAAPYNRVEMRKPPITVNCDCGESKQVAYGERWRCERCQRSWDTRQIPEAEYAGLLRRMRRCRLEAICVAGVLAAILIPLIVLVSPSYIFM